MKSLTLALGLFLLPAVAYAQATPTQLTDEEEAAIAAKDKVWLGVGARFRVISIPKAVFELLFVDHATGVVSTGYAAQFIRRKGDLDIEFAVEFEKINPDDGLWLDKGNDPSMNGQYPDLQVTDMPALGVSGTFVWHADITDKVQFRYGAGIGALIGFGTIKRTKTTCSSTTTKNDLDNPNACTLRTGTTFDQSFPPVLPLVNLVTGFRFKLADQFSFQLEVGLEDIILFGGIGLGYFF